MDKLRTIKAYIGETKFKAGIFTSLEIAKSKKYFEILELEEFANLSAAKEEFLIRYPFIDPKAVPVNTLCYVREKNNLSKNQYITVSLDDGVMSVLCKLVNILEEHNRIYNQNAKHVSYIKGVLYETEHSAMGTFDNKKTTKQTLDIQLNI